MRLDLLSFLAAAPLALGYAFPRRDNSLSSPNATCAASSNITWAPCANSTASVALDCGFLAVPFDYFDCSAGFGLLAAIRLNATKTPKLGPLFFNPGGPGDSGLDFIKFYGVLLSQISGGQYDIVSWDPRGVGASLATINYDIGSLLSSLTYNGTAVINGPEYLGNFTNANGTAPPEVAFRASEPKIDYQLTTLVNTVLADNGANLTYMGTAAGARDMLSLSDAIVGPGKKVNYWGISYGTVLGSYFLNMFPSRAGRVILDGIVNPVLWTTTAPYKFLPSQMVDTDKVFDEFTSSCAAAGPEYCALAGKNATSSSVAATVQAIIEGGFSANATTKEPLSASSRAVVFSLLSKADTWSKAATAILELATTSNTTTTNSSNPTRADGSQEYNFTPVSVICGDAGDFPNVTTTDIVNEIIYNAANVSELFGSVWYDEYLCHKWSPRAVERYSGPWNATLQTQALLISNLYDNITPLVGAQTVANMLGSSAVLLKRDGFGHTSLAENSTCTWSIIASYFVNGTLPMANTTCATDRNYFNVPTFSNSSSFNMTTR